MSVKRRVYSGERHTDLVRFRMVGARDPVAGSYHLCLTNIPPEKLTPEDIAQSYAARWVIERFSRELERRCRADEMPRTKGHVVEALVHAALITFAVGRHLLYRTQDFCSARKGSVAMYRLVADTLQPVRSSTVDGEQIIEASRRCAPFALRFGPAGDTRRRGARTGCYAGRCPSRIGGLGRAPMGASLARGLEFSVPLGPERFAAAGEEAGGRDVVDGAVQADAVARLVSRRHRATDGDPWDEHHGGAGHPS